MEERVKKKKKDKGKEEKNKWLKNSQENSKEIHYIGREKERGEKK